MAPLSWVFALPVGADRDLATRDVRRPSSPVSQSSSRNGSARCDMSDPFERPRAAGECPGRAGLRSSYARSDKTGNIFLET
jgi:hypothetical protein